MTIMKVADTHISAILRPSYDGHERFNKYTVLIKSSAVMNLHLTLLSELNDLFYHISYHQRMHTLRKYTQKQD